MLTQALSFLIETLGGLFLIAVLLRFLLQWARAPFHNPVSQFVVALTDFAIKPLRRIVPGLIGLDLASLALAWAVQTGMLALLLALRGFPFALAPVEAYAALGLLAVVALLRLLIYVVLGVVFVQAILSWVNPRTPVAPVLNALANPFLRPLRRVIPPIGGVDLTPLGVLIVGQLLLMMPLAALERWVTGLLGASRMVSP